MLQKKDFQQHRCKMKSWLMQREYLENLDSKIEKDIFSKGKELTNNRVNGIPFVVTYHPLLSQLKGIIHKHL